MAELDVRTAALQSITMTRYVEGFTREMIEGFGEKNAREFLGQALDHLLETAAMLGNVSDRLASNTGEAEPTVFIDFKQATDLLAMFGGEPNEITLHVGEGHSGRGMYASYTDMPEEGTIFLGNSDQEAMPDTPSAATPAAPGEVTEIKRLQAILASLRQKITDAAFGMSGKIPSNHHIDILIRQRDEARAALSHPAPVAAPASVPEATEQLVIALAESKGWLRDYARGVIEDAIDRKHLEAAPAPASEAVAIVGKGNGGGVGVTYLPALYSLPHGTKLYAAPTPGDSADAPVQQAGGERMSFEKAMVAAGYNKPERGAHANSGYLYQRDEDRFVGWELRAALKGEQPEPSGSERGEVS